MTLCLVRYPAERQVLSHRFERENAAAIRQRLSAAQRSMVEAFERRLAESTIRLVAERCPCDAAEDVTIAEVERYGLPLTTVLCQRCGTLRTNPYLDDASLDEFYRTTYQTMYARAPQLELYFGHQMTYGERVAARYEHDLLPDSNILEVGCGAGGGLTVFQRRGFHVAGCELSRELVEFGRSKGVDQLWHGTIDEMPESLASCRWDLIYLHHVFEHVQSPRATLASLAKRLTPQGRVLTIVPDILRVEQFSNPGGDILKFLHVAHKFNYTADGLRRVGAKVGLTAAAVEPPANLKTAWSEMPELWMEFRASEEPISLPETDQSSGTRILQYLHDTEQRFLADEFAQLSNVDRPNLDQRGKRSRSRNPVKRLLMWWRGHQTDRAA
jgi:SAM-dependent methyltransferase